MADNSSTKKLGFADMIKAKINKDKEKEKTVDIEIKSLGGLVTFVAPPVKLMKKTLDAAGKNDGEKAVQAQDYLIYSCCPEVKNHYKELMKAYEVKIPSDLVDALFNAQEQQEIMKNLMEMSGFDIKAMQEQIKNS